MDPLALLERPDKWFLGGGRTLIYAPPFPQYLHTPGLWDEAHLLDFEHPRPYTWTLLDENDKEIPLRWESHSWRPDRMTRTWTTQHQLHVTESACCLRDGMLAAEVSVQNLSSQSRTLSLALWTIQRSDGITTDTETEIHSLHWADGTIDLSRAFSVTRRGMQAGRLTYYPSLHGDRQISRLKIRLSQHNSYSPDWRQTPFFDAVPSADEYIDWPSHGEETDFYILACYALSVPPQGFDLITVGTDIYHRSQPKPSIKQAVGRSEQAWREWFAGVPSFECSDPYLTNAYWYRWFGLRLNAIEPPADGPWNYRHPAVCEGIQYFRDLISYSAQVHMRELRWMHDPTFAQGSLRNFIDHQKPDGNFPGNIYATFVHNDDMYHADWGRSLLDLHAIHPDGAFLEEAYEPLCRYARFLLTERDPGGTHLYDVVDQWETGQEYMHRYTAVDPNADGGNELHPHLKGVDATLYMYNLFRALAEIAAGLEKPDEAAEWEAHADATEQAILDSMWDAEAGMFSDVNAATLERTGVRAAVDFYPFLTLDLGADDYLRALREHLLNPEEFWTEYPVPAEAANDPDFSAEPFWRGERKNCPWNGRVWPMTNSHVAEALARAAQTWAPDLEPAAAEMILKFVRMMTVDGDPARPNSYEHYNPRNGTASYYRGIDDYMHSYIVDLIIRFVAGVQPQPDGTVIVNPLPMGLDWFELKEAPYQGHRIGVRWDAASGLTVSVDGEDAGFSPILAPLPIPVVSDEMW